MNKLSKYVVNFCLLAGSVAGQSTPVSLEELRSRTEILEALKSLKPLPKVHYSWPLPNDILEGAADPLLQEYVRLTHAVSISGEWATLKHVSTAVRVCKAVNLQSSGRPASIAINYSPWHREFDKELPATDVGPTYHAELARFRMRLETIRQWLSDANREYETSINVSALLLDTERFVARRDDKTWNQAITAKYDAIYEIALDVFPQARVEWYGRGIQESANAEGWSPFPWNTFENKTAAFSCSLYRLPEISVMRETFRRTLDLARQYHGAEVTPWVALASGYRRQIEKFQVWDDNWDYDLVYSWMLGAELNDPWYSQNPERFASWSAAKVVVFYPAPFNSKSPAWGRHFVAYVRGANGVKSLPN